MTQPIQFTPAFLEYIQDPAVRDEFENLYTNLQKQVHSDNDVTTIVVRDRATPGRLIGIQRFTTTGTHTYTPTAGTQSIIFELQGAGGGSSGIASPGAGKVSMSRAGGGGAWLRKRLDANFSPSTIVIGAKGSGGSSGDNAGSAGGNTTWTDSAGNVYSANGGPGGNNGGSGIAAFPNISNPVGGGTATGGDENVDGVGSLFGVVMTATLLVSGGGAPSKYSGGAAGVTIITGNTSSAAADATGYGGGGGAPAATGTGAARAGQNGSDGYCIVWEFS